MSGKQLRITSWRYLWMKQEKKKVKKVSQIRISLSKVIFLPIKSWFNTLFNQGIGGERKLIQANAQCHSSLSLVNTPRHDRWCYFQLKHTHTQKGEVEKGWEKEKKNQNIRKTKQWLISNKREKERVGGRTPLSVFILDSSLIVGN